MERGVVQRKMRLGGERKKKKEEEKEKEKMKVKEKKKEKKEGKEEKVKVKMKVNETEKEKADMVEKIFLHLLATHPPNLLTDTKYIDCLLK